MRIVLKWKYLKYDIDLETWKSAKTYITAGEDEEKLEHISEAQSSDDEWDRNYCIMKVEESLSNIHDILHKFMLTENGDGDGLGDKDSAASDNSFNSGFTSNDEQEWALTFAFDGRRNVNARLLALSLHRFVVLYVLQEWAKIANNGMEENYVSRLESEANKLREIAYRKETPYWEEKLPYEETEG